MTKAEMLFAAIATIGVLFCRAATDEQIKHSLFISNCYVDDADAALAEFRYARQLCGADSNRFARLICEVAHTNNTRVVRGMISDLGTYGTPAQLPFLYSQVSNTQYGVDAVQSILKLEGITSNSVAMVESYLVMTNSNLLNRYYVSEDLIRKSYVGGSSPDVCALAKTVGLQFASNVNVFHDWLDDVLQSVDPTYVHSKRRLAVMRAARVRTTDPEDLNYITNAINELVAYPEANLPE